MKKKCLLAIVILLSNFLFSQEIPFKITKSDVLTDDFKNTNLIVAQKIENNELLFVRSSISTKLFQGNSLFIERYNNKLKLINSFELVLEYPIHKKNTTLIGVFYKDSKVTLVNMFYDIKEKAYTCSSTTISIIDKQKQYRELFKISNTDIKKIGEFALSGINKNENNLDLITTNEGLFMNSNLAVESNSESFLSNKYEMVYSGDSGIAFIKNDFGFAIGLDLNGKKQDALKLYSFDYDFNKTNEFLFVNTDLEKKYHFENIGISIDSKSLFVLSKVEDKVSKSKKDGGKYTYEILKITNDKIVSQQIEIGNHYVKSLRTLFFNDKIFCVGFYSDKNDFKYKGVCKYSINQTDLKINNTNFSEFTDQIIIDKYGELKDEELKFLKIKNASITQNEEIILNAEETYFTNRNDYSLRNFSDIVSVKINNNGNISWARNINRKKISDYNNSSFNSFSSMNLNNSTYIFINANEKIKNLSNNRIEFKDTNLVKNSNLNLIRIKENGDFDYLEILDNEENIVPFMVSKGIVIDDSIYFFGCKNKEKQLLKVSL
jgi:hypothetical protein